MPPSKAAFVFAIFIRNCLEKAYTHTKLSEASEASFVRRDFKEVNAHKTFRRIKDDREE